MSSRELERLLSSMSDEEMERLAQLLHRVAQNAEELERVLELAVALAELVEELKPVLGEAYEALAEVLELAEEVDFGELVEQLKARLDEHHSSR
ncbi:hypothetical protein [Candidatus Pyrohabitans sp.]